MLSAQASAGLSNCNSAGSDPDGDGFGWENGRSCRVVKPGNKKPTCQSSASDPDGDGFGWENGASCRVGNSRPVCLNSASDSNGDGFGWENGKTCVVDPINKVAEQRYKLVHPACSDRRFDSDNDGYGWENSRTCTSRNYGDGGRSITDLVLVTGQSNALGAETVIQKTPRFDAELDSSVRRVYAFTNTGWTIAGLRQIWDRNWYPRSDIAGDPANNFAFHFAKTLVRNNPQKVVGIIMITAPGESIANWNKNSSFDKQIDNKVTRALAALPHKSAIDAVLWHQGESDYYANNYYSSKLRQVIGNVRAALWARSDALFICGETLNSPVNSRLMALNTDGDSKTGCVSSAGLKSLGDDLHFSADSLRKLGARYAHKYDDLSY